MLTPLEIENKKFSKQMMNGYNVEEIDDFLDVITVDYEKLYKEVSDLKSKVKEMEDSVSHYKNIENTLQNTLVMAQSTADEIKKIANQQADQIIKEAELKAKEAISFLKTERIEEMKKFEEVKKQFDVYKAKMEALLISQLELLKENEPDYPADDLNFASYDDKTFYEDNNMNDTSNYSYKEDNINDESKENSDNLQNQNNIY